MRLLTLLLSATLSITSQDVRPILDRAMAEFRAGRVEESLDLFDRVARLAPDEAPYLWQRGIAQYYAGKFKECRDMFASHRTVNPDDVENAAWHFLCVAQLESPEAARKQMLRVGPDSRAVMREVYEMFRGNVTQAQVLRAAGNDVTALFYARLYSGLYLEATGKRDAGRAQIEIAAENQFARAGGYMHDVARVHLMRR